MDEEKTVAEEEAPRMTREEVIKAADELLQQKDRNHPTKSGSYSSFLNTLKKGRKLLAGQKGRH
jgi:hypothetical protein